MDPFTVIERLWWAGVPVALVLGVLLTLNPLALPVLGTALGIGTAGSMADRNRSVQLAGAFGAGLLLVYTLVGVLAGQIDGLVESVFKPWAGWGYLFLGILLLGLGALLLFRPSAFCLACARPPTRSPTMLGAFFAGIPAGFVNCPACAGIVIGVAAAAGSFGSPLYSTAVMFAFGFGHAAALVGIAWLLTRHWYPPESLLRRLRPVMALLLFAGAAYFLWFASQWGLDTGPRLA